ncbi:DNA-binding protein [Bacillus wiedmannii]|uniref:helix-turn-helix domain-containing protein n=1 Tax=Bacillus cereus group TaxID=86661 RepID=UPI000BEF766B|nr:MULTISPECIES: helix-turn-helix domain-containing protein [Bacillus cereus group]KAA0789933.1 DNA-binding protein [Bacillus sp. BB081]PEK03766.1 DNA-binding protein [Bacillus wiedmannii]PEM28542.1 DNA-binding protein [Bacillus wiedmannii]PEM84569.1 DNA-binding protein [Bacillus wiedmannii]PEO84928.1 DNA-binding protein [Bacillus wiedmannii]
MNMYTVKELSLALQKHEETIKRWLRSGKFPNAFRNSDKEGWRIPEGDLVHFKQGTGFVKEDSQQNQQVIRNEVEESELVKLAYEVVTLTSPTHEMFTLLSVVGIKRTLEILLIIQQSTTKVKNPDGFIKKAIRENWSPTTVPVKLSKKQSKHIYDFNQLDYEAMANQEQHEYQPKVPFFNWLEE